MGWLEEAKKRAYDARACYEGQTPSEYTVIHEDAPRAYELLERAKEIALGYRNVCADNGWTHSLDYTDAFLRDLEGKEARDAQDEKG